MEWKQHSRSGSFKPASFLDEGIIQCFDAKNIEKAANTLYNDTDKLLMIVIDPLRIHAPVKKEIRNDIEQLIIQGNFSIDAIIDRIPIQKNKKGKFSIHVKHFD